MSHSPPNGSGRGPRTPIRRRGDASLRAVCRSWMVASFMRAVEGELERRRAHGPRHVRMAGDQRSHYPRHVRMAGDQRSHYPRHYRMAGDQRDQRDQRNAIPGRSGRQAVGAERVSRRVDERPCPLGGTRREASGDTPPSPLPRPNSSHLKASPPGPPRCLRTGKSPRTDDREPRRSGACDLCRTRGTERDHPPADEPRRRRCLSRRRMTDCADSWALRRSNPADHQTVGPGSRSPSRSRHRVCSQGDPRPTTRSRQPGTVRHSRMAPPTAA